jgi:hypothetical protein
MNRYYDEKNAGYAALRPGKVMTNSVTRRCFTLLAITFLLSSCAGNRGPVSLDHELPAEKWEADLHVLSNKLPGRHANAFHAITREEFDSAVGALSANIPRMSQDSIYVGFRQIVTMIGDGHTNIQIPANWPMLPLRFRWFGDPVAKPDMLELRITQASSDHDDVVGKQVLRIGDIPVADVYNRLTTIIGSGETEGSSRVAATSLMLRPDILRGLGIVTVADTVRITLPGQTVGKSPTRFVR